MAAQSSSSSSTSDFILEFLSLCVQIPTSILIAWYDSSHTNLSSWQGKSAIWGAWVNDEVTTRSNGQLVNIQLLTIR